MERFWVNKNKNISFIFSNQFPNEHSQTGPSGRSLVEIQQHSGANINISKKGEFSPGTRNRIVTITGQPNAIALAHYLIEQKIQEEETKRARQTNIATIIQ